MIANFNETNSRASVCIQTENETRRKLLPLYTFAIIDWRWNISFSFLPFLPYSRTPFALQTASKLSFEYYFLLEPIMLVYPSIDLRRSTCYIKQKRSQRVGFTVYFSLHRSAIVTLRSWGTQENVVALKESCRGTNQVTVDNRFFICRNVIFRN